MLSSQRTASVVSLLLLALAMTGCEQPDERWNEAAQEAVQREEVEQAEARYESAVFDTVDWYSESARRLRGRAVYLHSCQKCHGSEGRGSGELAREQDMELPAIGGPDWLYHGDIPEIRHRIYVGHGEMMPSWGLAGLSERDVDAVAYYIEGHLRPAGEQGEGGDTAGVR